VVCVCVSVCVCVCVCVCAEEIFLRFCNKYLLYINAYIAEPASSLQDFAQVIFANVCSFLAHASSTGPAHAIFRLLSYRFR